MTDDFVPVRRESVDKLIRDSVSVQMVRQLWFQLQSGEITEEQFFKWIPQYLKGD